MQYLSQEYNQYHFVGVFEGEKSKNHIYFIQIWHLDMLLTSSWRHFCHLTSNLLTKFLKSVIITTGKQSIPFFSVFLSARNPKIIFTSFKYGILTCYWRHRDVIVASFLSFDVKFADKIPKIYNNYHRRTINTTF